MTQRGVAAARRLVDQASAIIDSLTPEEWLLPSGCEGWRVQDVVAHLAAGAHLTADPATSPPTDGTGTAEQQMEAMVALRRDWSADDVQREYSAHAKQAVDVLASLQAEPFASAEMALLDLGTYPTHVLADVVAFDHYCHLHADVLAPHGPIKRVAPSVDDELLQPVIGWMLLGLPQMQGRDLDVLQVPLALVLTGPGGGRWILTPAGAGADIQIDASDRACSETVSSTAQDFVRWATARASWRGLATMSGDGGGGVRAFVDRLNII
jgi:uncharacterized protein (TIGR03083 family)